MIKKNRIFLALTLIIIAAVSYIVYQNIEMKQRKTAFVNLLKKYSTTFSVDEFKRQGTHYFAEVEMSDVSFVNLLADTGQIYDTPALLWRAPAHLKLLVKFNLYKVPKVCIILDDAGYNFHPQVDWVLALKKLNVTVSILPKIQFSAAVDSFLLKNGIVTMMHLPLQPHGWPAINPGAGLILVKDDSATIRRKFDQDIKSVGKVTAVSNHEGSLFTENKAKMNILLNYVYSKNLFFVDSRTTKNTVIPEVAKNDGYIFLQKDKFIDNKLNAKYIEGLLNKLVILAHKRGYAVGIGHITKKETMQVLKNFEKRKNLNITFVNVRQMYSLKRLGLLK